MCIYANTRPVFLFEKLLRQDGLLKPKYVENNANCKIIQMYVVC